jgi:hypothetical protein
MTNFDVYSRDPEPTATASPEVASFDIYNKPPPDAPQAAAAPTVGYGEDIGKGFVGGVGRGVAGTLGIGGTLGTLGRWGLGKAGVPEEYLDKGAAVLRAAGTYVPAARMLTGPGGAEVQKSIEDYTGKFYEPQTIPGQYASTLGEFAPGALIPGGGGVGARVLNTVVPALTSETAGQLTKGTAVEPYARFAGGLVSGPAAAKAITPFAPAEGAYQRAVAALERENIPLTAGQRTGNKKLQWTESSAVDMPLVGGQAARLRDAPLNALDRAVTERVYSRPELRARGVPDDVNLPDPQVAVHGPESLSDNYTRLTQAPFVTNPQFHNRMTAAQDEYNRLVQPHNRSTNVRDTQTDITNRLWAGNGRMAGDEYQSIRSQIGTAQRAPGINPREQIALAEYKRAMDQAYMAGLPPADAAALAANNRSYALMKQIQPAVDKAGEHLSPLALATAVRSRRPAGQYAARRGDLDELANAASVVMKPLPQSGTASRLAAQSGGGGTIGAGVGALVGGGPVGALIGAGIGAGVPLIAPGLATSRLGQAYLGNRALPQNARDILAQTMMQQAISQPSIVERNRAEREAYEKRRRAR